MIYILQHLQILITFEMEYLDQVFLGFSIFTISIHLKNFRVTSKVALLHISKANAFLKHMEVADTILTRYFVLILVSNKD